MDMRRGVPGDSGATVVQMQIHRRLDGGTAVAEDGVGPARQDGAEPPVYNLVGERIAFGPLRRDLIPTYQRWFNDFTMLSTLDRFFRPTTPEQVANWFERRVTGQMAVAHTVFTIWERATNRPIGNIALQEIDSRNRTAELGIFIGEAECRGRGYGTEATRLMMDFAFSALGLHSVMLRVFAYNEAALHIYERVGFRPFGRRRQCQFMDGQFWDVIYMECLAEEFSARPASSPFKVPAPGRT